jgi:hypothetical protein
MWVALIIGAVVLLTVLIPIGIVAIACRAFPDLRSWFVSRRLRQQRDRLRASRGARR